LKFSVWFYLIFLAWFVWTYDGFCIWI